MPAVLVTWIGLAVVTAGVWQATRQGHVDRFFMRVFRDLGRYKAKKRRYGNQKGALMATLLRQDDPLQELLLDQAIQKEEDGDLTTYTKQELWEYGDGRDGRPLLLALFGRVYDVSSGDKFYGPDGPYGMFAGRDVTYSLATACKLPECLEKTVHDLQDNEKDLQEGKRWLSFFHLHDKYPLVGKLLEDKDSFDLLMEDLLGKEQEGDEKPIFLQS